MRNGKHKIIQGVCLSATLTFAWRRAIGLFCLVLAQAIVSSAQDEQPSPNAVGFKTLVNFDGTNGGNPYSTLVQGTDGNLYGTTWDAGVYGGGNVFKMTSGGSLTVLYNFCAQPNCADGSNPLSLVLGTDGNFHGVTSGGGANTSPFGGGAGTVFKITPSGTLTTLYNFCALPSCTDGGNPGGGLVQGTDGNFYGTTNAGGNSTEFGTVFKMTPEGALTTLYTFCSQANCADGGSPAAALIQATNGNFYGTAQSGGAYGGGTVFKITPKGALTTIYSFCAQPNCADGSLPRSPLVQAASGNFYGATANGGANNGGKGGTVFRITPAGALTTLYSFCAQANCSDGNGPIGNLVQAADGNFYGATYAGGTNDSCNIFGVPGCGTVFKITPGGMLTTLHDFDGTDGEASSTGLVQRTNGIFYGGTFVGGTNNPACIAGCGTVFGLSVGLPPFVETLPTLGKVGEGIRILGTDLTGAISVSFNGTAAAFKVVSPSEIETRVPTGATTGFVTVITPTRTLKSNVKFRVLP